MAQRTHQSKVGASQSGQPKPNRLVAEYDFAVDGGVTGDIALRGDTLPSGAHVEKATIITETAPTSAGAATVALKAEGAADLNAADAISGAPWSAAGIYAADKFLDGAARVKTTADRAITATVGTADLTAGKFKVVVDYWMLA